MQQDIDRRISEAYTGKKAIRADAVKACGFILSGSNGTMNGMETHTLFKWAKENYDFFAKRYGEKNIIRCSLHMDEKTPHLHLVLTPLTKDGRLCAKELFDKDGLKTLQTDYAKTMQPYGLERGIPDAKRRHIPTAQFYKSLNADQREAGKLVDKLLTDPYGNLDKSKVEAFVEQMVTMARGGETNIEKIKEVEPTQNTNYHERGFFKGPPSIGGGGGQKDEDDDEDRKHRREGLQSKCSNIYGRFDAVIAFIDDVGYENIKRIENIRSILEDERYFKVSSESQIEQAFTQGISKLRQCHNEFTFHDLIPNYIGWLWASFFFICILFLASIALNYRQSYEKEKISEEMVKHKRFGKNVMEYMRDNMEETRKLRKYMEEENGWNLILEKNLPLRRKSSPRPAYTGKVTPQVLRKNLAARRCAGWGWLKRVRGFSAATRRRRARPQNSITRSVRSKRPNCGQ